MALRAVCSEGEGHAHPRQCRSSALIPRSGGCALAGPLASYDINKLDLWECSSTVAPQSVDGSITQENKGVNNGGTIRGRIVGHGTDPLHKPLLATCLMSFNPQRYILFTVVIVAMHANEYRL